MWYVGLHIQYLNVVLDLLFCKSFIFREMNTKENVFWVEKSVKGVSPMTFNMQICVVRIALITDVT